jgi:hypothetical protein
MKLIINILIFLISLSTINAYESKIISNKDFVKRHNALIEVLIKYDIDQNYPEDIIKEGELHSSFNLYQLILSDAYADSPQICFFGGWPTYKQGGRCRTPWKFKNDSSLKAYGPRYDYPHNCGGDNLFRCNPTLFGSAPSGKGQCIKFKSYSEITKKCHEKTKNNIDKLYEEYKSNNTFRKNYQKTTRKITTFCQNNSAYKACNYLLQSISDLKAKICANEIEPILNKEKVSVLKKILGVIPIPQKRPTSPILPTSKPVKQAAVKTGRLVGNKSCQIEGTSAKWRSNCAKLFKSKIPNEALKYALNVLKVNATSFKTNKCFNKKGLKSSKHHSMKGLTANKLKNNLLKNGVKNKCQIVINNTDDRSPSPKRDNCRGKMYYIDLCSGSSPKVTEDYFNLGTGTCRNGKNGFKNGSGLRTTVKGAFFTHVKTFDFIDATKQKAIYRKTVRNTKGLKKAVAVQLFGIQNTNNLSSKTGKYMHISPHRSSWGCPSIRPKNYYMIQALAKNGPSLVLNWGKKGREDLNKCTQ